MRNIKGQTFHSHFDLVKRRKVAVAFTTTFLSGQNVNEWNHRCFVYGMETLLCSMKFIALLLPCKQGGWDPTLIAASSRNGILANSLWMTYTK